jgi:glycerol-3-phosphate dehydrogenase
MAGIWSAEVPLPGGDFAVDGVEPLITALRQKYPFLDDRFARRLVRAYGTEANVVLGEASRLDDLGRCFGWNLTEREVRWLMTHEWARTAADVLWRRSKIGLRLDTDETAALDQWMHAQTEDPNARLAQ